MSIFTRKHRRSVSMEHTGITSWLRRGGSSSGDRFNESFSEIERSCEGSDDKILSPRTAKLDHARGSSDPTRAPGRRPELPSAAAAVSSSDPPPRPPPPSAHAMQAAMAAGVPVVSVDRDPTPPHVQRRMTPSSVRPATPPPDRPAREHPHRPAARSRAHTYQALESSDEDATSSSSTPSYAAASDRTAGASAAERAVAGRGRASVLPAYCTREDERSVRPSSECLVQIEMLRSVADPRHGEFLHRGHEQYPSYSTSICSTHPYHLPLLRFSPPSFRLWLGEQRPERTLSPAGILVSPRKLFRRNKPDDVDHVEMRTCVGPGDGVLECLRGIKERIKALKAAVRNASKGRAQPNEADMLEDRSQSLEDLQARLADLEVFAKDVRAFSRVAAQMEEHHKQHTYFVLNERYVHGNLLSHEQGRAIHGDQFYTGDERVCGITVDTYAFDCIKNEKPGQPNADSYAAQTFGNRVFFGVADGIGWGEESRRASQSALCGLMMYLNGTGALLGDLEDDADLSDSQIKDLNRILTMKDTHDAARCCLRAFEHAHKVVWANSEARTTLCGGIIFQLQDHPEESDLESDDSSDEEPHTAAEMAEKAARGRRWVFVGSTVGDSLIYRYSRETNQVMEVSRSDRSHGVRDAGGALGGKVPDTRNLLCYCCLLDEGDLLLAVSDGVHDNLDPEVLGVTPHQLGLDGDSWRAVPDDEKMRAKNRYKEEKLADVIGINASSARDTCTKIIQFVKEVTKEHREAYEAGGRLQRDWDKMKEQERQELNEWVQRTLKHPVGKFDHVTCMCVRVGLRSNMYSYEAGPKESPAPLLPPESPWWANPS